jgi:hypothetical protein
VDRIEVFPQAGVWEYRVVDENGRILAESEEEFTTSSGAARAARRGHPYIRENRCFFLHDPHSFRSMFLAPTRRILAWADRPRESPRRRLAASVAGFVLVVLLWVTLAVGLVVLWYLVQRYLPWL